MRRNYYHGKGGNMQILLGFGLCLSMVIFVGLGFYLGRKQRKVDMEKPTEEEIRKSEDLNNQAEQLFNYTAHTAYGGK